MNRTRARGASRVSILLALATFVGWIVTLQPAYLLAAIVMAATAYGFFLVDSRGRAEELAGYGSDAQDRVLEGSETTVSPGLSVGGIHLSFEFRSRWKRGR